MSSGPSSLGTLLATRLDAVLGTTLAQHPILLNVKASNAVPASAALHCQDTVIRGSDQAVKTSRPVRQQDQAASTASAKNAHANASRPQHTAGTSSAQTALSETAKLLLALLLSQHKHTPVAQGRQPLWQPHTAPLLRNPARNPAESHGQQANDATTNDRAQQGNGKHDINKTDARTARAPSGTAGSSRQGGTDTNVSRSVDAGRDATSNQYPGKNTSEVRSAQSTSSQAVERLLSTGFTGPAATLARALAQAVTQSGAFYESHLAELTFGARLPASLFGEPQATLGRNPPPTDPARGPTQPPSPSTSPISGQPTIPGIHPQAVQLVHQQLDILAQGVFAWQGEAWPGARMHWEMQAHNTQHPEERSGGEVNESNTEWSTRLRLQLPALGEVDAVLSIAGDDCRVHLLAPRSAKRLEESSQELRGRFKDAGLTLIGLDIGQADLHARADAHSAAPGKRNAADGEPT